MAGMGILISILGVFLGLRLLLFHVYCCLIACTEASAEASATLSFKPLAENLAENPSRALKTDQFKWLKVSSEFIEADENLDTSTETSTEASTRLTLPSLCSEKFNFCSQDKTYVG